MKLKDVKERIDAFFDNITAEELYAISVLRYGFSEITVDLENVHFETTAVSHYLSDAPSAFDAQHGHSSFGLALAA